MFNQILKHKAMPKGWLGGVMTFLHKKKARGDLDNYRPIALINMIYKIWATIMSQRLNPILNLLTDDDQYAYKSKRSTIDILAIANNQFKNDATQQMILFDFSKAFDNIERDILWTELYEGGIPIEFVQTLRIGHEGNILRPKCDGYIGKGETNNKGVFQGIPLSATLFIIYAGRMIEQYNLNITQEIKNNNPQTLRKT